MRVGSRTEGTCVRNPTVLDASIQSVSGIGMATHKLVSEATGRCHQGNGDYPQHQKSEVVRFTGDTIMSEPSSHPKTDAKSSSRPLQSSVFHPSAFLSSPLSTFSAICGCPQVPFQGHLTAASYPRHLGFVTSSFLGLKAP